MDMPEEPHSVSSPRSPSHRDRSHSYHDSHSHHRRDSHTRSRSHDRSHRDHYRRDSYDISRYTDDEAKNDGRTLHVAGLPNDATDNDLRDLFAPFGQLEKVELIRDPQGRSRCFGFITFINIDDANKSVKEDLSIHDKHIYIDVAKRNAPHKPSPGHYMGSRPAYSRDNRGYRYHNDRYRDDRYRDDRYRDDRYRDDRYRDDRYRDDRYRDDRYRDDRYRDDRYRDDRYRDDRYRDDRYRDDRYRDDRYRDDRYRDDRYRDDRH